MTKSQFIAHAVAIYRAANRSDSHDGKEANEGWMHPDMAGPAVCQKLDEMFRDLREIGVLTPDELSEIYDNL